MNNTEIGPFSANCKLCSDTFIKLMFRTFKSPRLFISNYLKTQWVRNSPSNFPKKYNHNCERSFHIIRAPSIQSSLFFNWDILMRSCADNIDMTVKDYFEISFFIRFICKKKTRNSLQNVRSKLILRQVLFY